MIVKQSICPSGDADGEGVGLGDFAFDGEVCGLGDCIIAGNGIEFVVCVGEGDECGIAGCAQASSSASVQNLPLGVGTGAMKNE